MSGIPILQIWQKSALRLSKFTRAHLSHLKNRTMVCG